MNISVYEVFMNKLLRLILSVMFLLTVACGKNYSSLSPQLVDTESGLEVTDSPEFQKIQAEIETAELEALHIESEIQKLAMTSPLKMKLGGLKDLVKNLKSYFDNIKKMLDDFEAKIKDQISKLDPANPSHKKLIERLEKALEVIQKLKDRLNSINFSIKDLLEQLFQKIEDKIDQSGNPIVSAILKMLLEVLKREIIGKLP